jgi:hypothetical protein
MFSKDFHLLKTSIDNTDTNCGNNQPLNELNVRKTSNTAIESVKYIQRRKEIT